MADADQSGASQRERMGYWPDPPRCEVRAVQSGEQCPEKGVYALDTGGEKVGIVCERCLPEWLHLLTKRGRTVSVARVGNAPSRRDQPGAR